MLVVELLVESHWTYPVEDSHLLSQPHWLKPLYELDQ
jgi:hypothetical protein